MKLCTIYLIAFAALAADASDANWPQFRGPSASGVGAGAPPTEWNVESGKNVRWKAAIPGLGHSSPVVWADRIFVTSAVPASGESSLKVGLYGDITPVKGYSVFAIAPASACTSEMADSVTVTVNPIPVAYVVGGGGGYCRGTSG